MRGLEVIGRLWRSRGPQKGVLVLGGVVVLLVVLVGWFLFASGDDDEIEAVTAPPGTDVPATTAAPATTSTTVATTTTLSPEEQREQEVIAAYEAAVEVAIAAAEHPVDPEHPGLEDHYTGGAFNDRIVNLENMLFNGWAVRLPDETVFDFQVTAVRVDGDEDGDEANLDVCWMTDEETYWVDTGEPVRWDGDGWILSNFGSQQNLMRVFTSLTELTGDKKYLNAAAEATQYMFDHHSDKNGLLYWGGHQFVDLETMDHQFEGRPHELKSNFPYYDFMWEVDPVATRRLLRAIWNAHVLDWSVLDLNRHADYNGEMGRLWDHEFAAPEPFFEGIGLTFINFGTDMIQAAMALYFLDGDEGARLWGNRLFEQYVRARHPETGDHSFREFTIWNNIAYGLRGVPETFFIGRDGRVAYRHIGPVTEEILVTQVEALLAASSSGPEAEDL
jgi:hypothetical protein